MSSPLEGGAPEAPSAPSSARPPASLRGPRLRIVSVNDVYSLENLPRLANLIRHYATHDPADAFLAVLAGDFVGPSMLSSLDRGRGMVECINAAGITHLIFGNHEDDIPPAELRRRIREFRGTWLSTNMRTFDDSLPAHQVIAVTKAEGPGARTLKVGLVGVVMTDAAVYRRPPFGGCALELANDAVLREAAILRDREHCDLVIPITHQAMKDDRELIMAAASSPFPLILGGHEHDVHVERDDGTWIVKAGSEATRAAVIEIEWPVEPPAAGAADTPTVSVRLEPVAGYEEDAPLRALVDGHMSQVHELESAILMLVAPGELLSSIGSRARQTSMGTLVCSRARDILGAEACILNGGGVRASRDYEHHLAYGDIKAELPFDNEMVVVALPGRVLRDAVAASRSSAPVENGGFLQVDDRISVSEPGAVVTAVAGQPLDLDRVYRVAAVRAFFTGMDHLEPLVAFGREHPEAIPHDGVGRELKEVLVEALALALWHHLGGFDAIDSNHDGVVTEADVSAAVARWTGERASPMTVTLVMNAVDKNHDRQISRAESDASE